MVGFRKILTVERGPALPFELSSMEQSRLLMIECLLKRIERHNRIVDTDGKITGTYWAAYHILRDFIDILADSGMMKVKFSEDPTPEQIEENDIIVTRVSGSNHLVMKAK